LPDDIIKNTENLLTIPMDDSSRSINLANSVAIVGYEYLRQIDG
jgi:tRNA (cytidine/uridine-2'-O-)-methyltransferase